MAAMLVILGLVGLVALAALWRGLVLSVLWGWFLVPLGLPGISIPLAIGIAMTAGMVTQHATPSSGEEGETTKQFIHVFLAPLIALGIGWVAHQFI